jgi:hypothetical protein
MRVVIELEQHDRRERHDDLHPLDRDQEGGRAPQGRQEASHRAQDDGDGHDDVRHRRQHANPDRDGDGRHHDRGADAGSADDELIAPTDHIDHDDAPVRR